MAKNLGTTELIFPQGTIKGLKNESVYGDTFYSFEGIPYAKPPIGALRFKAPQPAEPWTEILDCTQCRSKPKQNNEMTNAIEGSEDCLYLNVYAKKLQSEKPLPVLVYIYGGGFYMGEASRERTSPDYFMSEDVVLVNFNYRVCSLGFLSLKDPALEVPGNAGLKDQVLALKWVKKYISHFNGDPENITVFGESAGGASTHIMMLTEQTRGLFQRAIPQSGCALNYWVNMPQTDMAYRLAKFHGYNGENIDKNVLAFLLTLDSQELVDYDLLNNEEKRNGIHFPFGPSVEPYVAADCVIPKPLFEMLKTAWTNSIPMLIGCTSDEGILMYPRLKMDPKIMNAFESELQQLLLDDIRKQHTEVENQKLAEKIRELHFGNKQPNSQCLQEFLDFYGYYLFIHGIMRTVLARLKYAPSAPTYFYRFNFDSPDANIFRTLFCGQDLIRGAAHADELSYLFWCKESRKFESNSDEYKTMRRMIALWTSFAKNGDPNNEVIKPVNWKPVDSKNPFNVLNISNEVKFMEMPEKSKLEVWNSLYKKEKLY